MKKIFFILIFLLLGIAQLISQSETFEFTVDSTQADTETLNFVDPNWRYTYIFTDLQGRQIRIIEEYTPAEKDSVFQEKVDALNEKINTFIDYRDDCDNQILYWQERKQTIISNGLLLVRKRNKYQNAIGL